MPTSLISGNIPTRLNYVDRRGRGKQVGNNSYGYWNYEWYEEYRGTVSISDTDYRNMQDWVNDICETNSRCRSLITQYVPAGTLINLNVRPSQIRYKEAWNSLTTSPLLPMPSSTPIRFPIEAEKGTIATYRSGTGLIPLLSVLQPSSSDRTFFERYKLLGGHNTIDTTLTADFSRNVIYGNIMIDGQGAKGRIDLHETPINRSPNVTVMEVRSINDGTTYNQEYFSPAFIGNASGNINTEQFSGKYYGDFHGSSNSDSKEAQVGLLLTNESKTRYIFGGAGGSYKQTE